MLKKLSEDESFGVILRAKGMVDSPDGQWIYFDMVPEEYEIRTGAPQVTGKLCVIGSKMDEGKLAELFWSEIVMFERDVPVYLITGFLESGKTRFLDFTIRQQYFQIPDLTLLLGLRGREKRNMIRRS